MKVRSPKIILRTAAVTAAALLSGCPLPFDYNGKGSSGQQTPDPSSPNVTASVMVSYAEQGGSAGTIADNGSFASGKTTTVTLSTPTNNSVIYYTDDGTILTKLDTAKKINGSSGSLTLTRTTTPQTLDIYAIAVGPSMLPSLPVRARVNVSPYPIITLTADRASTPEGGGTAMFTISSSVPAPDLGILVNLQTSGTYDTAYLSGLPASGSPHSVTLDKGATATSFSITASADPDGVNNTATLTIIADSGNPPDYTVGAPASTTVVIQDNRTPYLHLTSSTSSVTDNGQSMVFTVTSSFALTTSLTVNLQTSGTYEPADVTGLPSAGSALTLTLPAGATSVSRTVTANTDPGEWNNETVGLALVTNTAYNIVSPSSASVTVTDTSPVPLLNLSASDVVMVDGQIAQFTIMASEPPDANLTLPISGSGYAPGKVNFPPSVVLPAGAIMVTFPVGASPQVGYPAQNPVISLGGGTGYLLGSSSVALQITDDALGAFTWDGVWNFNVNAGSNVGNGYSFSTTGNVVRSGGVLTFGGVYLSDNASVSVPSFDKNRFTIAVKFNLADLSFTPTRPILAAGTGSRWFIAQVDPNGNLSVDLNNHTIPLSLGVAILPGADHTLVVAVDAGALTLTAWVDGVSQATIPLPAGFTWNTTGDNTLTSTDYSRGMAFKGTWDWVFAANGWFDYNTVLNLMATDPDL